jgi:hypothetical protein
LFNDTWSVRDVAASLLKSPVNFLTFFLSKVGVAKPGFVFAASVFLVSVPVFFEAPLVRYLPLVSLILTGGWFWLSRWLMSQAATAVWGDLLMGFTGSWLAGSLYWGGLRWEPTLHLPVEAIALPMAIWCIRRNQWLVGAWFYVGSLFGTAVTDIYFYLVDLIPHWRQLMLAEPDLAVPIFRSAIAQVHTPWGIGCAAVLATVLLVVGFLPLRYGRSSPSETLHWWAFSGAVLSTILVDGLFWLAALAA